MAIFTTGYGGRWFANLIVLLKEHDIAFLVDVRRFPKSEVPEYNKVIVMSRSPERSEGSAKGTKVWVVCIGDALGGFRQGGCRKYGVVIARASLSYCRCEERSAEAISERPVPSPSKGEVR